MKNHLVKYHQFSVILFIMLLIIPFISYAQLEKKYQNYSEHTFGSLKYGLFKPAENKPGNKYPLILYLHGYTDTVSRDLGWYAKSFQKENPCFVLTPKSQGNPRLGTGWGSNWIDTLSTDLNLTLQVLDSVIYRFNVDTNRLYIYGASMGGSGTYSVLSRQPGRFAGAYVVCGRCNPGYAEQIMQTPLWIFHGEIDDIVPVENSRNLYNRIKTLGGKQVRYTEYPGVKHNSWENVAQEKKLISWLFNQKRRK